MKVSICIATYGDLSWRDLSWSRAFPSTEGQGAEEVLVLHDAGSSVALVRNTLGNQAKGDWLLMLDADDELAPGYLDAMRRALEQERHDGDLLLTPAINFVVRGRRTVTHFQDCKDLRDGNWLTIGTLVHRDLFRKVGGFRERGLYEDWELWLRCHLEGARIVKVFDAVYLAHYSRMSRNRAQTREHRNYWHQRIGHDVLPDYYDPPTAEEDSLQAVAGVRKLQYA